MSLSKLLMLARKCELKYQLFSMADIHIDMSKISPNAIKACKMLQDAGFESYLVGGSVRDLLMNKTTKDWDITTNATPDQVKKIFPKHFALGEKHGTIVAVLGPDKEDQFEITTYRVEGDYSDGRRPDYVAFASHVEDDLSRRDLTINAMAYDPINDKLIDPHGGQQDLANRKIKAVGDPNKRFEEDGLRTMRVARFAARFGFDVDPETQNAITNHLGTLQRVSKERFTAELLSTLMTPKPSVGLNILSQTGALGVGDPILGSPLVTSTFPLIDANNNVSLEIKVALLLHKLGSQEIVNTLKNLKFPNDKTAMIVFLKLSAQEFAKFFNNKSPLEARKFFSFIKNHAIKSPVLGGYEKCLSEFLSFAKALNVPGLQELNSMIHEPAFTMKDLDISGNDLIQNLNMKPGPEIKKVLDALYNKVLSNPELNEKSKLLELAAQFEKIAIMQLSSMIKQM